MSGQCLAPHEPTTLQAFLESKHREHYIAQPLMKPYNVRRDSSVPNLSASLSLPSHSATANGAKWAHPSLAQFMAMRDVDALNGYESSTIDNKSISRNDSSIDNLGSNEIFSFHGSASEIDQQ